MASVQEIVSTKDPEDIKKRRSTIKGKLTSIQNQMADLLEKTAGSFDHTKIKRTRVLTDLATLKKSQENFEIIHDAYMHYRVEGKDETNEEALVLKQEKYYFEVIDKICESLDLYDKYEDSYKIFLAAQPDPDLAKKEAEEKSTKEALAKQLKDEEELQKQETESASKIEEERIRKELKAAVVKNERQYNEAVGRYRTAKKYAEDMALFARGLSKEQVVSQAMEFAHVRSLPTYDTKNMLLDRFEMARDATRALEDAIEAESGSEDIKNKVKFDGVAEDASVQDLVRILNLLLNAKMEYNGKGSVSSQPNLLLLRSD